MQQDRFQRVVPLVGRILLALVFVMSGFNKIGGWDETSAYMTAQGMPLVPMFLMGAIVLEVGVVAPEPRGLRCRLR